MTPPDDTARRHEPAGVEPAVGAQRRHVMPFGAEIEPDGTARFRLWAPSAARVSVVIEPGETLAMRQMPLGWWEATARAAAGARYRFRIDDGLVVPDPASRFQPDDVSGPSELIDPLAHRWTDAGWRGRPWEEAVLYELHIGSFTEDGTFAAAAAKLDALAETGITAIEIMPVADFPGRRNWGYDGVLPYAPDSTYGSPSDFKRLIEAAHERGIMVLLDVVYNHFGPDGNYLGAYAKPFFTERFQTPWGAAIDFCGADSQPVRSFFIHNALYWLLEYNLDGLRLDAVHAIKDESPLHVLEALATEVRAAIPPGRHVHLLLENDDNRSDWLARDADGWPPHYTAQWNDDFHHAMHVLLTGDSAGYYGDYADRPVGHLGRCLYEGFAYQGELSPYRGAHRGQPSTHLPPGAFVTFLQNHDQIGNRAFGERLSTLAPIERRVLARLMLLLAPFPPMLFMGEEWDAGEPFLFFCDFSGELAQAVRNGRRREFARFPEFADPAMQARIPDPLAEETFRRSRLDWHERGEPRHAQWLAETKDLLAIRAREIVPLLASGWRDAQAHVLDHRGLDLVWRFGGGTLRLIANLSDRPLLDLAKPEGRLLAQCGDAAMVLAEGRLAGWAGLVLRSDAG
jgi:malto-oligosyltrehalose trehalohydrolase